MATITSQQDYIAKLEESKTVDFHILGCDKKTVYAKRGEKIFSTELDNNAEWFNCPNAGGLEVDENGKMVVDPSYIGSEMEKQDWRHMLTYVTCYPYLYKWTEVTGVHSKTIRAQTKYNYGW